MGAQRLRGIFVAVLTVGLLGGSLSHASPAAAAAGELDRSFAGVGFRVDSFFADQRTGLARMAGGAQAVAVDPAGRLIAITGGPRRGTVTIARYLPNGELDASFGSGGAAIVQLFPAIEDPNDPNDRNPFVADAYLQADGKLVIAGGREGGLGAGGSFIARIGLGSATLDPSFGVGGMVAVPGETVVGGLTEDSSGKPVVAGRFYPGYRAFVGRFTAAGAPDPSFGQGGQVVTFLPGVKGTSAGGFAPVVAVGDEIVAASAQAEASGGFAARYQHNGKLDPGFGDKGIARFLPDARMFVSSIALQPLPEGKLLVLGDRAGPLFLTRLDEDGKVDRGFGFGGTITATPKAATDNKSQGFSPGGLVVEPSGRIVVAGTINGSSGGCYRVAARRDRPTPGCFQGSSDHLAVARYLPSGAADCSFGHGGISRHDFASGLQRIGVAGAFIDPAGRLLLGGSEGTEGQQGFLAAAIQLGPPPRHRLRSSVGPTRVRGANWIDPSFAALRQGQLRLAVRIRDPLTRRCSPSDLAAKLVTLWSKPEVIARARKMVGMSGKGSLGFGLTEEAGKLLGQRKSMRLRLVLTLRHGGGERQPILRREILLR